MVITGIILSVVAASVSSFGSPQSASPVRDLVNLTMAAPPELAADILLKLIERGQIADPEWKREILETAWNLAPQAAYPFDVDPAVAVVTASEPGSLSAALATGLSTAGLQARSVSQMMKLDAKEARKMFLQMSPPRTQSPDCADDRYRSHRAYFAALKAAGQTFSAAEIKSGARFGFFAEALRFLSSPEDFELALDLLRGDERLTRDEFERLIASWSEMLARARFTDRLFSSRPAADLAAPLVFAGKEIERRGALMEPALRAFRSYFVSHTRAARCGESQSRTVAEEYVRAGFNKAVAVVAPGIQRIQPDEIAPEGFGESAKVTVYDNPGNSVIQQLKHDYSRLRFGDQELRQATEWQDGALRFLNDLDRWSREPGQSNRELFFLKAEWYGALVYAAPEGQLREFFLERYVTFLSSSPVQRESPPEWATSVHRLIGAAGVSERGAWLAKIESAGDAVVAAYCQLARLNLP